MHECFCNKKIICDLLAAAPPKNGSQSSTARGSPSIAQSQSEGADNSSNAMKKVNKIKKRYEKKLLAAEEELQAIREVAFLHSVGYCGTSSFNSLSLSGFLLPKEAVTRCGHRTGKGHEAIRANM